MHLLMLTPSSVKVVSPRCHFSIALKNPVLINLLIKKPRIPQQAGSRAVQFNETEVVRLGFWSAPVGAIAGVVG